MLRGARKVRGMCAVGAMALTLGLAACGGDDDDEQPAGGGGGSEAPAVTAPTPQAEGGGAGSLRVTATESGGLGWDPAELTAPAGEVTITMDNPDRNQMPHNVAIEGAGVQEVGNVVQPGDVSEVTATLEPGEYTFYCSVGQHRANGMEGTLTVE